MFSCSGEAAHTAAAPCVCVLQPASQPSPPPPPALSTPTAPQQRQRRRLMSSASSRGGGDGPAGAAGGQAVSAELFALTYGAVRRACVRALAQGVWGTCTWHTSRLRRAASRRAWVPATARACRSPRVRTRARRAFPLPRLSVRPPPAQGSARQAGQQCLVPPCWGVASAGEGTRQGRPSRARSRDLTNLRPFGAPRPPAFPPRAAYPWRVQLVRQLLDDVSDVSEVNAALRRVGRSMGVRAVDEFLAKSGAGAAKCTTFRQAAEAAAGPAMRMFLGVQAAVGGWSAEGDACSLRLSDNPITGACVRACARARVRAAGTCAGRVCAACAACAARCACTHAHTHTTQNIQAHGRGVATPRRPVRCSWKSPAAAAAGRRRVGASPPPNAGAAWRGAAPRSFHKGADGTQNRAHIPRHTRPHA